MRNTRRYTHWTIALILFIIALVPRIFLLGHVPTGISNDELDYAINAKTLFLTGRGLTGAYTPVHITDDFPRAELSSVLIAPILGPLPFSLILIRLPFAILGAASIVILYFLALTLIGKQAALFTGILATINPWSIFFSRTTYDAPIATFFFMLGFLLLLHLNGWRILWALIPFLLGFHTYMGTMVLFLPVLLIFLFFSWRATGHRRSLLPYIALFGICMIFVIRYALSLHQVPAAVRLSELASPFSHSIAEKVDGFRRTSVVHPIIPIFVNKATVFLDEAITSYAGAFSPILLFVFGDTKHIFTLFYHGLFYVTDALFIILGFVVLFQKNRRTWYLLLSLLLIAPIPSVISNLDTSYASRSYLMQPVLLLFAGYGLARTVNALKNPKMRILLSLTIAALYILQVTRFGTVYFLRNTVNNSESYNFSARVMARYVQTEIANGRDVLLLAGEPRTPLKQYAFYTNAITRQNVREFMRAFDAHEYRISGVRALPCPPIDEILADTTLVVEGDLKCDHYTPAGTPLIIAQLADGGSVYKIFNGKLCMNETLGKYPQNIHFYDFTIEKLSDQSFCRIFITKYE